MPDSRVYITFASSALATTQVDKHIASVKNNDKIFFIFSYPFIAYYPIGYISGNTLYWNNKIASSISTAPFLSKSILPLYSI